MTVCELGGQLEGVRSWQRMVGRQQLKDITFETSGTSKAGREARI